MADEMGTFRVDLEGLNLRIDPVSKRLVDAGPAPAAPAQAATRFSFSISHFDCGSGASRGSAPSQYRPLAMMQ